MSGRAWVSRTRPLEQLVSPERARIAVWTSIAIASIWAALAYRLAYRHHFAVRFNPAFPQWWDWSDQGRYYRAAQAWANLSLDPTQHWYFAGYPLLGAAIFRFDPGHPFYLVDLACLLLTGLLLSLLAGRLSARSELGRIFGAAVFLCTVALTPLQLKSYVEPWTTTPTAPITLASFLLAFRLWELPSWRRAATLGFATAAVTLFRPVDVAPLAITVALSTVAALRSRAFILAAAAALGASIPVLATVLTYVAVFGWRASTYLQQSALTGFEWRLIPLHWVTLFVSSVPEFHNILSLSQAFPWIIPGLAGMVACLFAARGQARLRHVLVTGAVLLHCLLYLAYRDLHPDSLFRFGSYHYFKWCVPVFGVYAVLLVTEVLLRRRFAAFGFGLAVAAILLSWRMTWQDLPAPDLSAARRLDDHTLLLPQAPRTVYDALFVPAEGGFAPIFLSSYEMQIGDRTFVANADFKAFPADGGLIFTVLRPMPSGPATIHFNGDIWLRPGPLRMMRAHLFWRWPNVVTVVNAYYRRWAHDK